MKAHRKIFVGIVLGLFGTSGCSQLRAGADCRPELNLGRPVTAENPMGFPGSQEVGQPLRSHYEGGQFTRVFLLPRGYSIEATVLDNTGKEASSAPHSGSGTGDEVHITHATLWRARPDGSREWMGAMDESDGIYSGQAGITNVTDPDREYADGNVVQWANLRCAPSSANEFGMSILK